jgi:hypothetical protein
MGTFTPASKTINARRTSGSKWTIFSGRVGVTLGLALLTASEHNLFLLLLITQEFLNDQRTRQKKPMCLWADAGHMAGTLFDHPDIVR